MVDLEERLLFHQEDVALSLDEPKLRQWLYESLQHEGHELEEINFIFCSDEYLYAMNMQYLQHDDYTDVITFPYQESGQALQGDVFISTERVADNAQALGQHFEQELRRVMIHGCLHIMGYTDKTPEERAGMSAKEDFYLARWA